MTSPDDGWRSYAPEQNARMQHEGEMEVGRCVWFPALSRLMQQRHVPYVVARWRLADTVDGKIEERGDV
jgi:hypothetical protein